MARRSAGLLLYRRRDGVVERQAGAALVDAGRAAARAAVATAVSGFRRGGDCARAVRATMDRAAARHTNSFMVWLLIWHR